MVVELEPLCRNVPDLKRHWRSSHAAANSRNHDDDNEAVTLGFQSGLPSPYALQVCDKNSALASSYNHRGREINVARSSPRPEDEQPGPLTQLPSPPATALPEPLRRPSQQEHFTFSTTLESPYFVFEPAVPPIPRNVKRCRPRHDVDGPCTSSLSCKKRRIRQELITSRLSQPYSLPATHIINRDAIAAGDKRFVKLAATADANKRCPSTQSSVMRRAAVLNCVRTRVRDAAAEKGNLFLAAAAQQTTMTHRGQQAATGGRFLTAVGSHGSGPRTGPSPKGSRVVVVRPSLAARHGTPLIGTATAPPYEAHLQGRRSRSKSPSPGPSGSRVVDNIAGGLCKPSHLSPTPTRSPVLGPADGRLDEVADYDEMSFPGDDSRYNSADEDEDGEVYSDFGVIFGEAREADNEGGEEHSYEDYLDELDGIPWVGR